MAKKKYERRVFEVKNAKIETRESNNEKHIVGIIPYNSYSEDLGFREIIAPSAFKKTIQENKIYALQNHDTNLVLANNKNETLKFEDTEDGLICDVLLDDRTYAQDLYKAIARGDVSNLSFGFSAIKDEWITNNDGSQIRVLKEVKLYEVSFGVPFPAYSDTTSEARNINEIAQEINLLSDDEKNEIVKILTRNSDKKDEPADEATQTETKNTTSDEAKTDVAVENKENGLDLYKAKIKLFELQN